MVTTGLHQILLECGSHTPAFAGRSRAASLPRLKHDWRTPKIHLSLYAKGDSVLDVDIGGFHVWRLRGRMNPRIPM
jgi:hypothetical protein